MHSPAWSDLWSDAKQVDIVGVAESYGAKFKRATKSDLTSHCPLGCANKDGFVVNPDKGIFLCRPSGSAGDVVDMVAHLEGCDRVASAEILTGRGRPGKGAEQDDAKRAEAAAKREHARAANAKRAAERERLEAAKLVRDGEAVASILDRAVAFQGSRAEDYLLGRGAGMPRSMTRDLRFVEEVHYWGFADQETDRVTLLASLPAMVAIIRALDAEIVGAHITYLDPREPRKFVATWEAKAPPSERRNIAKKFRKVAPLAGAMIRLGVISDTIVLAEGIETAGSYFRRGFGPEDASYGTGLSIDYLCGGSIAQIDHPTARSPNGKPTSIPNGYPDLARPGVILPPHVKRVVLLGDGDSEPIATRAKMLTAARRYRAEGREVFIDMAAAGDDFASMGAEFEASSQ